MMFKTLILAITLIAEAGLNPVDHAAILHVLDRRAGSAGIPIEVMALRYSAVWKRKRLPPRILESVDSHPELTATLFQNILLFETGDLLDPCKGKADHWGAPHGIDLERATRAGWKRVACGKLNLFWSIK